MNRFKFYQDAGHGWLAVKRKFLKELEIEDKITTFSYQKGQTVYLEEDMDAQTFISKWKEKYNREVEIVDKYGRNGQCPNRSAIRSYEQYKKAE